MILLGLGLEDGGDQRTGCLQRGEHLVEIETTLMSGPDDAGEHLLCVRPAGRAIPATDLAMDDRGPDGLDRRVGRRKGPQPVEDGTAPPARLIGTNDRTPPDLRAERRVRRRGHARRAMQHLGEPPGVTVSPTRSRSSVAILSSDTPQCLCNRTVIVTTPGPSCAPAAPNASEVCSGCRPCTRCRHATQHPTSMSNRRMMGWTTGRSSWYWVATRVR